MGRRGPPPKPLHLKLLEGTFRKDRAGKRTSAAKSPATSPAARPPVRMAPPAYLGRGAKAEWRRILPLLGKRGVITLGDRAVLAMYCQAYQRWIEYERLIDANGSVQTTDKGFAMPRPEVLMATKQAALLKSLAVELGLTPASRARVDVPAPETPKDPIEELLFGNRRAERSSTTHDAG